MGAIACLGWLTFLSPTLGCRMFLYVAVYALLLSVAMIVWLLVFGVDEQPWKEQARAAETRAQRIYSLMLYRPRMSFGHETIWHSPT